MVETSFKNYILRKISQYRLGLKLSDVQKFFDCTTIVRTGCVPSILSEQVLGYKHNNCLNSWT